jgi:hypothetical protein
MPGAAYPPTLPAVIANGAGGGFITNPMPPTPPGSPPEAASIELGFPPITMQPELSGGLPPDGQDMNGFLFLISSHTMYVQCGQLYQYNSTLATDIGGYLAGTVLGMLDGTGMWLNLVNGNTTDPDTGGAGWVPLTAYGFTTLTGLTGGTVNLTAAQSKYAVIVLDGVLSSNLTINFPENIQQWLIVNNTTGAFVTTAKTAAGGSSGPTVPQSGFTAPLGIYSVGDGNIYPTVAPLSVPISQSATPLTLVERTSAGYAFAAYFNQTSSLENPTIGAVFVQNSAADGYLRKINLANFITQLAPPLFTSPALTGTPTAPTAPVGTNNTQLATTAFVKALLGGSVLTFRTGTYNIVGNAAPGSVVFSSPFPNACLGVVTSVPSGGFQPGSTGYTTTQFTPNGNACGTQLATYLAWGN